MLTAILILILGSVVGFLGLRMIQAALERVTPLF